MIFEPKHLDYELSPYTGMTRETWLEACAYLLGGIFKHIKTLDDPVVMPRTERDVTYPHKESTGLSREVEEKAEYFEGLARTFFVAAQIIHEDPTTVISGHNIRDYYKKQVLKSVTKGDPNYVGRYEEFYERAKDTDPFRPFQQTVEACALVICLENTKEEIWNTYTKEEQDKIADFLLGFGHGNTVPQNWRLFNMIILAFLNKKGYDIDHDIMRDHAQNILNYYTGDGWYRDGHSFDYYSCWAFNVYGPIWNTWYGYEHEPLLAKQFEDNSNKLMETYADYFDRDGFVNMWGRSNIYRNAATSPLDANFLLKNPQMDPGLARRIASGALLQFFTREDFLCNGVPSLGFYGQFKPLVQGYSCAESPLWFGKAFLCLHFPKDHPFWTAKENNGIWEKLEANAVKETTLDGPALCFTNHEANGETILRTGKILKKSDDDNSLWNYGKLSYNSKYPWESAPSDLVESQQYVLEDLTSNKVEKANAIFWHGNNEGILYRRQFFDFKLDKETMWMQAMNLSDFPVANGLIRVDKVRLYRRPVSLTLGAYGFPDNSTEIKHYEKDGAKAIVLKGHDYTGKEKQLAMTIFDGWESIDLIHSEETNPDSPKSIIIFGKAKKQKQYGYEPYVMISQVITKESLEDFTENEIFPISSVAYTDKEKCGGYGPVKIALKNGTSKTIIYEGIEGKLML